MWRYKDTLKIVISGSRTITDYGELKRFMSEVLSQYTRHHNVVIIAGGAAGVDQLAKRYA
jgi:predicted Rossmann fold nucleotide-binding protein DprA/Smf involved in DNA uptake